LVVVFASNEETAAMRIHNPYADENGETHFRDIDIEMSQVSPDGTTPNKITGGDGETRINSIGEIILSRDMHGKGHLSQAVGQMRRSVMIPID
jgi:hypothetical protein